MTDHEDDEISREDILAYLEEVTDEDDPPDDPVDRGCHRSAKRRFRFDDRKKPVGRLIEPFDEYLLVELLDRPEVSISVWTVIIPTPILEASCALWRPTADHLHGVR